MRTHSYVVATALVALVASACSDLRDASPLAPEVLDVGEARVPGGVATGWDLPIMGNAQLRRSFPGSPCMEATHRQFDFWVGEWNVYGTDGTFFGTNDVTAMLDGCLVQEHWISAAGFRGRSLNTFDRETGMWHQDWASQVPAPFASTARLRTSGGIEDGSMVLTGSRPTVFGFAFSDTWTWTEQADGSVIQTGVTAGSPIPPLNGSFTAVYQPGTPTPVAETVTPHCQVGQRWGETREADFLEGSFAVSADGGPRVGAASVETDLSDCLFVERFESVGGLRAVVFTYWDFWTQDWHRIWVDSEGERLALRGHREGDRLVFRGTEGSRAGVVDVRLGLAPADDGFTQTWEVSRDGGVTWTTTATLRYGAS